MLIKRQSGLLRGAVKPYSAHHGGCGHHGRHGSRSRSRSRSRSYDW